MEFKNMIQMNLFTKQIRGYRNQIYDYQSWKGECVLSGLVVSDSLRPFGL